MLTWQSNNPLDSLPDDAVEFIAKQINDSRKMSSKEKNLFKRFEGVATPESLAPAALKKAAAEKVRGEGRPPVLFLPVSTPSSSPLAHRRAPPPP